MIKQIAPIPSITVRSKKVAEKPVSQSSMTVNLPKSGQLWDFSMLAPHSVRILRWIP